MAIVAFPDEPLRQEARRWIQKVAITQCLSATATDAILDAWETWMRDPRHERAFVIELVGEKDASPFLRGAC